MTVNLSLETAKEMYNSGVESLKAFALENYPELKPLPTKWEDLGLDWSNKSFSFNSGVRTYHALRALAQLSQLKAVYNDGWEPTYNGKEEYYTILISNNVPIAGTTRNASRFLVFKSEELRNKFLKNFRDLIMQAKPLL